MVERTGAEDGACQARLRVDLDQTRVAGRPGRGRGQQASPRACRKRRDHYAPVPVSLSIKLDARGQVKSIEGDTPKPAAVADAARYMKTLRDSGQLAASGEAAPARGVTHQIERDAQGRHVLRRKRFSII